MWQAISASVKSMEEPDQRRMLVQNNSRLAVREAGYSEVCLGSNAGGVLIYNMLALWQNLLVALDVMQLLVDIENIYRGLNRTMETARIFEESMQARIAFLETRLDGAREKSRCVVPLASSDLSNSNNFALAPGIFKVSDISHCYSPALR